MIAPRSQHHLVQNFQRDLADVQSYIQARLQTDEPYLLNVNPAQVAEFQDELEHYVKQKQRQQQLRRPLPMSRDAAAAMAAAVPRGTCQVDTGRCANAQPSQTHTPVHQSSSHCQPSGRPSECAPSVVPTRLPGVEWLLAHNHHQHHQHRQHHQHHSQVNRYDSLPPAPSIVPAVPVMLPPSPMPFVHGFGTHPAMHHRTLKKQKTM